MFQFDRSDMSLRDGAARWFAKLRAAFDDWDLASWFAQPNSWLHGAAPVDAIGHDLSAVLQAARADRFIAIG